MKVSQNVQDLFGTTEAAVVIHPDPTPNREGSRTGRQSRTASRRSGTGDRLPPRERRGRD
jgi:hypothetical protein